MAKSARKPRALKAATLTLNSVLKLSQITDRITRDYSGGDFLDELTDQFQNMNITWGDALFTITTRDNFLGELDAGEYQEYLEALLAKAEYVDLEN